MCGGGLPSHCEPGVWEEAGSVAECAHLGASVPGNGSPSSLHSTLYCPSVLPGAALGGDLGDKDSNHSTGSRAIKRRRGRIQEDSKMGAASLGKPRECVLGGWFSLKTFFDIGVFVELFQPRTGDTSLKTLVPKVWPPGQQLSSLKVSRLRLKPTQ